MPTLPSLVAFAYQSPLNPGVEWSHFYAFGAAIYFHVTHFISKHGVSNGGVQIENYFSSAVGYGQFPTRSNKESTQSKTLNIKSS